MTKVIEGLGKIRSKFYQ